MQSRLKIDEARFLEAAERATDRFLRGGPEEKRSFKDRELVGPVARAYRSQHLTLRDAACELGLGPNDLDRLKRTIESHSRLRRLGLAALAKGASISRETWEARQGGLTAYQAVAEVLGLGTPIQHGTEPVRERGRDRQDLGRKRQER
jgi:hypothetical protein